MPATTARLTWKAPLRLTSSTRNHSAVGYSTTGALAPAMPALCTSRATGPQWASVSRRAASTWAGSVMSACTRCTARWACAASAAASASHRLTRAPPASRRWATARPMPWAPPVMMAVRPSKSYWVMGGVLSGGDGALLLFTQAFNAQAQGLPRAQEDGLGLAAHAHAGWGAGRDHITGVQGHEAAQVGHQLGHLENHGAGVAVLVAPAVHLQPKMQRMRVGHLVGRDQPGAGGAEGVAALALVPGAAALQLVAALGHIVDHAVAGHVVHGFGLFDVAGRAPDDHAQLDLPIGLQRSARDAHIVVRPDHGRGPLVEHHGLAGHGHARFGGVIGVVQPDADELADAPHAGAQAGCAGHQGQAGGVDGAQTIEGVRVEGAALDVGHVGRQIPELTRRIQQARFLLARGAIAKQFHALSPCAAGFWEAATMLHSESF